MNQNKPLGSNVPEFPQTEPEQTPESLDISIKETPSKPEEEKTEKVAEPEMVIVEPGKEPIQEPTGLQEEQELTDHRSSDIEEVDVTNSPVYLEEEASALTRAINDLQ